jgi:hypothetical protein
MNVAQSFDPDIGIGHDDKMRTNTSGELGIRWRASERDVLEVSTEFKEKRRDMRCYQGSYTVLFARLAIMVSPTEIPTNLSYMLFRRQGYVLDFQSMTGFQRNSEAACSGPGPLQTASCTSTCVSHTPPLNSASALGV